MSLIKNLQKPDLYPHPVREFHLYETHSSMVLTTGDYVYKIKKAVDFGFLDYSSLEKRKYHCEREIAFNKKLADDIYLEVVPIYGSNAHPSFEPHGEPIEYAVKMRQFPQQAILGQLLQSNQLTPEIIEQLTVAITEFHEQAEIANNAKEYGNPEHIHRFVMDNFEETLPLLSNQQEIVQLKTLANLTQLCYDGIRDKLRQRKEQGWVRRCHGDMHLNNIVMIADQPKIFDCIEFNEDFIWTDVMGDLGFIIMDLDEHNKPELARLLLNSYLEQTDDYSALTVLPYFCAYRAMVRAKVDQLRLTQPGLSTAEKRAIHKHYQQCLTLLKHYLEPRQPMLIIMSGFCASGKSSVARQIATRIGAIQIRSDVERKRLAGLSLAEDSQSRLYDDLYQSDITDNVYQHLADLAQRIIAAGFSVVVDATFLRKELREIFIRLSSKLDVPLTIVQCKAPDDILRERVTDRREAKEDVSEARLDVLEHQLKHHDLFTQKELALTVRIDSTRPINSEQLQAIINHQRGQMHERGV
ncbi:MAG: AAA family ATPase [Gammaproteobacteria bacterium]|nr:AAA family ATPase [Gammaproteobacteria bacterium]